MNEVVVTKTGGILELRLNRPEKKNALNGPMYLALADEITRANQTEDVRVVVLSAEGEMFTAGNDVGEFLSMARDFANAPPARFMLALANNAKPLVAAVHGPAIGVGVTLLLHADLVYASPTASFTTPFVKLGLVPEAGATLLMPATMGYQRAARLLLLGETLTADEAYAAGLVTGIVPAENLHRFALEQATRLAQSAPSALSATRALMRLAPANLQEHMKVEAQAFALALQSAEAREAFTAFAEKRRPVFAALPDQ